MPSGEIKKPHLRLAAENSAADIVRERSKRRIRWPLRELAANIIRVTRGAGRAYELAEQCVEVLKSFEHFRDACGTWPSNGEIQEALAIRNERMERMSGESWEEASAIETIVRGALQVSASRLVFQNTQERMGEHELYDGVNSIERQREERHRKWVEEQKALRPKPKLKAARRKRAAKTKKQPDPPAEPEFTL